MTHNLLDFISRFTPLVFLCPSSHVSPGALPDGFDIGRWSNDYTWRQDSWNGLSDFAQPVEHTLAKGEGDCEDYALVAASWAAKEGKNNFGLGFAFPSFSPVARHVIAYDENRVYSVGRIFDETPEQWVRASKYDSIIRRSVNPKLAASSGQTKVR